MRERCLMLLVIIGVACVASVPLAGGRLTRLADLEMRTVWALVVAAGIQVVITSAVRGGDHALHAVLHVTSYALVGAFLLANRRLVGMPVCALGVALNLLAIISNRGVMPAAASALRIAGIDTSGGFANSAAVAHPHLLFLGDVVPVPGPWPFGNVLSVGDLLIVTGALIVAHYACGSRLTRVPQRAGAPT